MNPVIVLAGGLGTRLRRVVSDVPKPLAPVAGKPFLWWLLSDLEMQGVEHACISVGYKASMIQDAFGDKLGRMRLSYCIEDEPLGTGGAVLRAARLEGFESFWALNGDTFSSIDLKLMQHKAEGGTFDAAVAVAKVDDASRYGTLEIDASERVVGYLAAGAPGAAMISTGIYLLKRTVLDSFDLPAKFSIEKDFFERHLGQLSILAYAGVSGFLDIGVPEDYELSQTKVPLLAALHDPSRASS